MLLLFDPEQLPKLSEGPYVDFGKQSKVRIVESKS